MYPNKDPRIPVATGMTAFATSAAGPAGGIGDCAATPALKPPAKPAAPVVAGTTLLETPPSKKPFSLIGFPCSS